MPTAFGKLMLRKPVLTAAIAFIMIAIIVTGSTRGDDDLGSWVGFVAAAFMLYGAALSWFFPKIVHRSPADVIEVTMASAISAAGIGLVAWILGQSEGFLFGGAIESAVLVVYVLVRATRADAASAVNPSEP